MAAVRPQLASVIWAAESKSNSTNHVVDQNDITKISMSANSVNAILDGGFAYGQLHCITSAADLDNGDLINKVIVPHLLSSRDATATIIDSTLGFDVRRLFKVLTVSMGATAAAEEAQQKAMQILGRVKIMKVFDFAGLVEAVEEWKVTISARDNTTSLLAVDKAPRGTIQDSDDEDEVEVLEPPQQPGRKDTLQHHQVDLIIIRDMSQVISPLLRSNYTHGQAQLDSIMKSLGRLTRDHRACTLVFASASSRPAHEADTRLSQFESCTLRSALGDGLGFLVDVHIFRLQLPVNGTAERLETRAGARNRAVSQMADVIEVVEDRYGSRRGRWVEVRCDDHGILCDVL
jgi:flavin-binding protein dodecin